MFVCIATHKPLFLVQGELLKFQCTELIQSPLPQAFGAQYHFPLPGPKIEVGLREKLLDLAGVLNDCICCSTQEDIIHVEKH